MTCHVCVVVHTPAHSQVSGPLTYGSVQPLAPGTLVRVPLGKRETLGVVWDTDPRPAAARQHGRQTRGVRARRAGTPACGLA